MSNKLFAESTTSTQFLLSLSKRQCNSLLRLLAEEEGGKSVREHHWVMSVDGLRGLDRRGLVFWHYDKDGDANGFGGMTKAGRLTAQLLVEAGLTIENTQTSMTLKRETQFRGDDKWPSNPSSSAASSSAPAASSLSAESPDSKSSTSLPTPSTATAAATSGDA